MSNASGLALRNRCGLGCLVLLLAAGMAHAQSCLSAPDMDAALRKALETTAQKYFEMSARGDTAALQQNSIPLISANFGGVESTVKDNQAAFTGAHSMVRPPFLLTADGTQPVARAEFLCGVFGPSGQTANSAVFIFPNLPPGKYAVTILDLSGGKEPRTLTMILQQVGTDWKLAGYYTRPTQAAGHDGQWFIQKARDFKAKGEKHNAWLYYREAMWLNSPVDFMSTQASDKLYDETQSAEPSDLPANGNAVDLNAGGKTYRLIDIFPMPVGSDLDIVVKYSSSDISDTQKTFQDNTQVMKALVTKFPESRSAFAGVVARAVDPSGHDYGSMLPMKDIR